MKVRIKQNDTSLDRRGQDPVNLDPQLERDLDAWLGCQLVNLIVEVTDGLPPGERLSQVLAPQLLATPVPETASAAASALEAGGVEATQEAAEDSENATGPGRLGTGPPGLARGCG